MSFLYFYSFVIFINFSSVFCPTVKFELMRISDDDNSTLTLPEVVRKYDYPLEEHHVTTSDGYILTLHRIPYGRNSSIESRTDKKNSSKVVYLQHGLFCSSADWIIPGPEKGLGYLLADAGYDVWMGNARGNTFSRRHRSLSPKTREFWDFSWHEIAYYDMPATIDYILRKTGEKKLFNIGYSQGTTTFYAMAALRPKYNKKIIAHFSLSPVVYMEHAFSPILRFLAFFKGPLAFLSNLIGQWEFQPHNTLLALVAKFLCKDDSVTQILCRMFLFAVCGYSPEEFDTSLIPMILQFYPAGASTKQVLHYAQLVRSGKFSLYDYGKKKNLKTYDSSTPPEYNVKNIKTLVYMFYSEHDWFSNKIDVDRLCQEMGSYCKRKILYHSYAMNHLDYLFGKTVKMQVYKRMIRLMGRL